MADAKRVLEAYVGVSRKSPEEGVLRLLIELGAQFVGAQEGSLLVLDERRKELVFAMTVSGTVPLENWGGKLGTFPSPTRAAGEGRGPAKRETSPNFPPQFSRALVGQRVPLGKGITGLAAQTREVQIGAPTFRTRQRTEPKSVLAAPMLVDDRLIGVITAVSFQPKKRFTTDDATLYARIATVAAVVVEQRRRLSALEALKKGRPLPRALSEDERLSGEIVGIVGRLAASRPHAKAAIARLLSDIETLNRDWHPGGVSP